MTALIQSECRFDILINQITQSVGEGTSTLLARTGGGMIYEVPNQFNKLKNAADDFDRGKAIGKLISIIFNWSY